MASGGPDAPLRPYRPDIDGLRAVAVAAVVLYHYRIGPFPGGFVGVDVFFVISGYLITAISVAELRTGRFAVRAFFERRLRRIVPALLALLAPCGVVALFLLLPGDLRLAGSGLLNAALFTSNLLFYTVADDYFAAGSLKLQPFLHTWSLSVEAQFYLLYPGLLLLARRLAWRLPLVLAAMAALSLACAEWAVLSAPNAAFYLLPPRAWELLLGGLLALEPAASTLPRPPGQAWTGLALIVAPALLFTDATPFPGAAALLPCLGAVLTIRGGSDRRGAPPLSWAPLVFLGRISYSLYLWHWPVLVFAAYGRPGDLPIATRLGLALLSIGLAALSFALVERPVIRREVLRTTRRLFGSVAAGMAAAALAGLVLDHTGRGDIRIARLPAAVAALADAEFDMLRDECRAADIGHAETVPCRFGAPDRTPSVLLWGNSYARMWAPALDLDARAHGVAGISLLLSKCLPLLGPGGGAPPGCASFNEAAILVLRGHPELRTVVLGANWFAAEDDIGALEGTLSALKALDRRVVVVLAPPQATFPVPRTLAMAALRHELPPPPIDKAEAAAAQAPSTTAIRRLKERYGFTIIDPADWLCDGARCDLERDGVPLFFDAGHVTTAAARKAAALFDPVFPP